MTLPIPMNGLTWRPVDPELVPQGVWIEAWRDGGTVICSVRMTLYGLEWTVKHDGLTTVTDQSPAPTHWRYIDE